ncbi:hypothetical protein RUM43_013470 [Polyplax serrata]|uniref:DNA-directed RNA polymerase I subunit RPA49 n=1 Tax=Polyplax serrata TaxID=468196 RepID=A0AAN8RYC5_POLSC
MLDTETKHSKHTKFGKVTGIYEKQKGRVNPVIVNFQNGEITESNAKNFKVTLTPDESGRTKVEVESTEGNIFQEVTFDRPKMRQYIAIRNKITKKVKVIEVDSSLLINSVFAPQKAQEDTTDASDFSKNLMNLSKIFGGKKSFSKLHQKDKLNVSTSLMDEDIKEAAKGVKQEEDTDKSLSLRVDEMDSVMELLPPCNRNASKLSEVYILTEILTEEELLALKDQVRNVGLEKELHDADQYSTFFTLNYEQVKKSNEDLENRIAGLLFAETLIKFLLMPSKQITGKKANFCSFSSVIHSKLLNEFCIRSGSSVSRPFSMRDKIACYIIALTLISCNFQIDLKTLAQASSVHLKRLTRLARVIGAVPMTKDGNCYHLKLPLPAMPKSSAAKGKRRIK